MVMRASRTGLCGAIHQFAKNALAPQAEYPYFCSNSTQRHFAQFVGSEVGLLEAVVRSRQAYGRQRLGAPKALQFSTVIVVALPLRCDQLEAASLRPLAEGVRIVAVVGDE